MHYFQFNIADYRKDTAHLSLLEHGVYRQLMDSYYLDEKPIETKSVMRRLSIRTKEEKESFENVVSDFFLTSECGKFITHKRIDAEIQKYHDKVETAKANGSKGGRPKKTKQKPKETKSVNSGYKNKPDPKLTNNHKPITINQLREVDKPKKRFIPPTLEELKIHCAEKNYTFNPETYLAHYQSNDWKVGKNKMKCWKSACVTWQNREAKNGQTKQDRDQRITDRLSHTRDYEKAIDF